MRQLRDNREKRRLEKEVGAKNSENVEGENRVKVERNNGVTKLQGRAGS